MSHLPYPTNRINISGPIILFVLTFICIRPFSAHCQKVGINTTSPQTGLHVIHDDGLKVTGDFGDGAVYADSTGTMMLFSPKTASFRVGRLTDEDSGAYEGWWDFFNTGDYSFVSGLNTRASAYASFASGHKNQATGLTSFVAGGHQNIASGSRSFVAGVDNTASSYGEFVVGTNALTYTPAGITGFVSSDRLFVVGNGANIGSRSNALTILKNGNMGVGTVSPSARLHIAGNATINDSIKTQFFQMTNGAGSNRILKSDVTGHGSWVDPGTVFSDDWNASGNNIYNTNTNNVGIGTTTPTEKLHVAGSIAVTGGRLNIDNGGFGTMIGFNAGLNDVVANLTASTFVGYRAGEDNTTGGENTAVGAFALTDNTTGGFNVALGKGALDSNISGSYNVGMGFNALSSSTISGANVAVGFLAMSNSQGYYNTVVGTAAGSDNVNGSNNTFIGNEAGQNSTGNDNVFIGNQAGKTTTGNNKLVIDNSDTSSPLIYGDFSTNKVTINDSLQSKYFAMTNGASNGHLLVSNANGQGTWTAPSSVFSDDWNSNAGHIYNANTLNVGIGTSSPTAPLHVNGNVRLHNTRLSFTGTGQGVFIGENAGQNDDLSTNSSVFIGYQAGKSNTSGNDNIAIGANALDDAATSHYNIAIGESSMTDSNMDGDINIGLGNFTLVNNETGSNNIAIGQNALDQNVSGSRNTALGHAALDANVSGSWNIAIGNESLGSLTNNDLNIAVGYSALANNVTGTRNVAVGTSAGMLNTGSGNVFLGNDAGFNETGSNKLHIANTGTGDPLIYGDFSTKKIVINDSLATKYFQMTNGATNNHVLKSDNTGKGTWTESSLLFHNTNTNNLFIGDEVGDVVTTGSDNTIIGPYAGTALTSGYENTGLGLWALQLITSGKYNTSIGHNTLTEVTTAESNTALGWSALSGITGSHNTALGAGSGGENTGGSRNVYLGFNAGFNNQGSDNIFIGHKAGEDETGSNKLFIDNTDSSTPLIHGDFATNKVTVNDSLATRYFQMTNGASNNGVLKSDNTGRGTWTEASLLFHNTTSDNLFIGDLVGDDITSGEYNTMVGASAGESITSGNENTAFGNLAMQSNTTGNYNTAIGNFSLMVSSTTSYNTALGWAALQTSTGSHNTGVGGSAGAGNTTGVRNTFVGYSSGFNNNGSDNVFIGHKAGEDESGSNKLYIDNNDTANPLIYGDFSTNEITINDSLTVSKELSVGTSTANSTLEINGSVAAKFKTPLVAGTTHPDGTGMVWRYNTGTGTITLPAASSCPNRMYVIINQTGSTRNISTYRDLTTTPQTTLGSSVALWLMSDGTEWWQIK